MREAALVGIWEALDKKTNAIIYGSLQLISRRIVSYGPTNSLHAFVHTSQRTTAAMYWDPIGRDYNQYDMREAHQNLITWNLFTQDSYQLAAALICLLPLGSWFQHFNLSLYSKRDRETQYTPGPDVDDTVLTPGWRLISHMTCKHSITRATQDMKGRTGEPLIHGV